AGSALTRWSPRGWLLRLRRVGRWQQDHRLAVWCRYAGAGDGVGPPGRIEAIVVPAGPRLVERHRGRQSQQGALAGFVAWQHSGALPSRLIEQRDPAARHPDQVLAATQPQREAWSSEPPPPLVYVIPQPQPERDAGEKVAFPGEWVRLLAAHRERVVGLQVL